MECLATRTISRVLSDLRAGDGDLVSSAVELPKRFADLSWFEFRLASIKGGAFYDAGDEHFPYVDSSGEADFQWMAPYQTSCAMPW